MEKLTVKLPSGEIRYITRIDEDNAASSIYESSGLEATPENIARLKEALVQWSDIEIIEPVKRTGCWIMANGGIRCYGH